MIEVFSRTGLYIVGFKVHRMSVAQAEEFYGPVLAVLEEKLGAGKGPRGLGRHRRVHGRDEAERMSTGQARRARHAKNASRSFIRAKTRCEKSATSSGPTDPAKAPPGSIRKEFGQTIMINAAHASDSAENAKREMAIVQVDENNFKPLIENFYARP